MAPLTASPWRAAFTTLLAAASFLCASCVCSRSGGGDDVAAAAAALQLAQNFQLDQEQAKTDMAALTEAPHALGSERQVQVQAWLEGRIKSVGATPVREAFKATVPNPAALAASGPVLETLDKDGVNLYGLNVPVGDPPCVVALATHYDTKTVDGAAYVGANDSGSSTVALLQQLAYLRKSGAKAAERCGVIGIFFDGEEAVLPNWTDGETQHPARIQDNTYGSRFAAQRLTACKLDGKEAKCLPPELGGKPLVAVILMDMIGSPGLKITRDGNSAAALVGLAAEAAAALGQPDAYDASAHAMEDDHIPFRTAGVATLDLIDFNHLDYWHRSGDDPGTLSYASVGLAAKIGIYVAARVAADPVAYLGP